MLKIFIYFFVLEKKDLLHFSSVIVRVIKLIFGKVKILSIGDNSIMIESKNVRVVRLKNFS